MYKSRLLAITAILAALWQFVISDGWMKLLQFKILMMDKWAGMKEPFTVHDRILDYYYGAAAQYDWWVPKILGTDFRQLGLRVTLDAALAGVGGLIGIRVASSIMLGAIINFVFLAPWMIERGDIVQRVLASGKTVPISRIEIVNQWSLWWGVAMMVVGAMVGLFGRPEIFTSAWKMISGKREPAAAGKGSDVLKDIEVPLWISFVGVPVMSAVGIWIGAEFFNVPWHLALLALPLILVLTIICTNSMALTSWTPTGALSKITQFTMGAIDHTNPASNLIPAGMTGEISANAANLLSDIKPGYMLGGKPRHQVIGHIIGIFAGAMAAIPLYFLLFLPPDAQGVRSVATIVSDQFAMPGAMQWKGVADIIARGLKGLPDSAIVSVVVAAIAAAAIEFGNIFTRGKIPLSPVSIGLGVILPPDASLAMFIGAFVFWVMGRKQVPGTKGYEFWVEACEPICAGLISGSALMGIGDAIINAVLG